MNSKNLKRANEIMKQLDALSDELLVWAANETAPRAVSWICELPKLWTNPYCICRKRFRISGSPTIDLSAWLKLSRNPGFWRQKWRCCYDQLCDGR